MKHFEEVMYIFCNKTKVQLYITLYKYSKPHQQNQSKLIIKSGKKVILMVFYPSIIFIVYGINQLSEDSVQCRYLAPL